MLCGGVRLLELISFGHPWQTVTVKITSVTKGGFGFEGVEGIGLTGLGSGT